MKPTKTQGALLIAALVLGTPALAEQVKREGVIVSSSDNGLNVRTREGPVNVVVTPMTKITEDKGVFNKQARDAKTLIPGLIIKVEGNEAGGSLTASRIDFKERDWRAAIAAKGGTMEQLAELRNAIIDGQEYVIRQEAAVYFKTGNATVGNEYKQALRELAQKAPSYGNYRISILGFADPRGNAEANERLSMRRAMAVSNFLRQTGYIQPGRVLSPSSMGEGTVAPGETAPTSNDEARRVVVRVVTPKTQLTR